jgi:hypothetical protein
LLANATRCLLRPTSSGAAAATSADCGSDGDLLYVRLRAGSVAAGQVWDTAAASVAPVVCGRAVGRPLELAARILSWDEEERARRALSSESSSPESLGPDWVYLELRPLAA